MLVGKTTRMKIATDAVVIVAAPAGNIASSFPAKRCYTVDVVERRSIAITHRYCGGAGIVDRIRGAA